MSVFPLVVGRNYQSRITVLNPATQAKVTGLTSANFTFDIIKGTTGNQATTGLVMTEVDAVNNPGEYDITISGSSGFPAAAGVYQVTATRTATLQVYNDTVFVTSDGTFSGSYGAASFTAVAANGRVTDGSVALANATVRLLRPSTNAFYAQVTSDSNGLWGPVYFDAAGTWTISVQRSGYSVATGTITVAGTTATGPGADIALTAIAASSGLTASSLWAYARRMMADRTGTKGDTEILQLVNEAISGIAYETEWPWLETLGVVNIQPAYTAGTLTATNGSPIITLVGGTWPTWTASAELLLNYQWYPVLTRDSNTQLTLTNNFQDVTVSASPLLVQWKYALPTDVMRISTVIPGVNRFWVPDPVSRAMIEMLRSNYNVSGSSPRRWAIEKASLYIWPYYTNATSTIGLPTNILYYRRPADLATATDNADWDTNHLELLHRAIDYQVAIRGTCMAGTRDECYEHYRAALARARPNDRTSTTRDLGLSTPYMEDHRPIGVNVIG